MASKKKYDAVVKTGTYKNNGEEKGRYENVGSVMINDDGKPFLILKRTFNPAGVPNPEDRDSVIVSFFELSEKEQQQVQPSRPAAAAPARTVTASDDIPF